ENARGFKRIDEVGAHCVALLIADPQQEVACHLAIDFEIPNLAARVTQTAGNYICIGCGTEYLTCRVKHGDCPRRQVNKRRNVQRHTVIEESRTTFEQCSVVLGQCQNEAGAWSGVDRIREGVAIEPQAQIQRQPICNGPLVSYEPSGLILIGLESGVCPKLDPLQWIACQPNDFCRREGLPAIVGAVRKFGPGIELVDAKEMMRV